MPTAKAPEKKKAALKAMPDSVLGEIYERMLGVPTLKARLAPFTHQLKLLRERGVDHSLIVKETAKALDVSANLVDSALQEFYKDEGLTSRSSSSAERPAVRAPEIKAAIMSALKAKKVSAFTLRDEEILKLIVAQVPALASYPRHERNRKIIDACANRKHGLIVRRNGDQREIAIAS